MVTCEFKHSLITPAYNRASWLSGLYAHLLELEYASKDFEWIIIDDGSQDETPRVVSGFITEGRLNIRYVRQENLGIHIAQNRAIELARGSFVTRIDTDDYLLPGALADMDRIWEDIPQDRRDCFAGVVGLTLNPDGTPRCSPLVREPFDSTGVELRTVHGATGDRSFCMRTEVMRAYPIPEYRDTKYVPESIAWRRIDRRYLTRFSNVAFAVCSFGAEGSMMVDLGASNRSAGSARSGYYLSLHAINEFWDQLTFSERLLYARSFLLNGIRGGKIKRLADVPPLVDSPALRAALLLAYPGLRLLLAVRVRCLGRSTQGVS